MERNPNHSAPQKIDPVTIKKAIENGAMTINQARSLVGLPPIDIANADVLMVARK